MNLRLALAIALVWLYGFLAGWFLFEGQVVKVYEDGSFVGCQYNAPCQD
jgi:hypothetical protein